MILASVAKLNIHVGDPSFERIMEEIDAAQAEGLQSFEIEVHRMETSIVLDVSRALNDLGYIVDYDPDIGILEVQYDE